MRIEISWEGEENDEVIKKPRKAVHLIGLVKMYKQLALTAREVGEHFLRNAMA